MITNDDLQKIGSLIDSKLAVSFGDFENRLDKQLEAKLETKLESKLEEKLEAKFNEKLSPIYSELSIIKKDIRKIKKDQKIITNFFDKKLIKHEIRLDKIDSVIGIPVIN